MDDLRVFLMHYFRKKIYWKIKKKIINILTAFFISYKSGIENFVKWFIIILWSNLLFLMCYM